MHCQTHNTTSTPHGERQLIKTFHTQHSRKPSTNNVNGEFHDYIQMASIASPRSDANKTAMCYTNPYKNKRKTTTESKVENESTLVSVAHPPRKCIETQHKS